VIARIDRAAWDFSGSATRGFIHPPDKIGVYEMGVSIVLPAKTRYIRMNIAAVQGSRSESF
jgi:hypothetical protein